MEKQAVYAYINLFPYWDNVQLQDCKRSAWLDVFYM